MSAWPGERLGQPVRGFAALVEDASHRDSPVDQDAFDELPSDIALGAPLLFAVAAVPLGALI